MTLAQDLAALAWELASIDSRKPKQAHLRRAISTAYYAVFHFLVDQAARHVVGTHPEKAPLRAFLARGVTHQGVKALCREVTQRRWPSVVTKRLGKDGTPEPPGDVLKRLCAAFLALQEERHRADYDLVARYTRANTLIDVQKASTFFDDWAQLPNGPSKDLFLYMLITNAGTSPY